MRGATSASAAAAVRMPYENRARLFARHELQWGAMKVYAVHMAWRWWSCAEDSKRHNGHHRPPVCRRLAVVCRRRVRPSQVTEGDGREKKRRARRVEDAAPPASSIPPCVTRPPEQGLFYYIRGKIACCRFSRGTGVEATSLYAARAVHSSAYAANIRASRRRSAKTQVLRR